MEIVICHDREDLAQRTAHEVIRILNDAIVHQGQATAILSSSPSQFAILSAMSSGPHLDWSRITLLQANEWIGLSPYHPGSLRFHLKRKLLNNLPVAPAALHEIHGDMDPESECQRLNGIIRDYVVDVALVSIGENAGIALNDPPADFDQSDPYFVVPLNETYRQRLFKDGLFSTLDEVPTRAITLSCHRILQSQHVLSGVMGIERAKAVNDSLIGEIRTEVPASILRSHHNLTLFLDRESSSLIESHTFEACCN